MTGELVTELQSFGVRVCNDFPQRTGGAGPADAGTLLIEGRAASVPVNSLYVAKSPFTLRINGDRAVLARGKQMELPVALLSKPRFYALATSDGVPYPQIGLLHGKDCLATTVIQTCIYWHGKSRCRFCGIELSLANGQTVTVKTPGQLAEVALKAKSLDSIQHIVLTTGIHGVRGQEIIFLANCASAIKKAADLPIHAQFLPPSDMKSLHLLKESGVDTVGIHIESFDFDILAKVAPAKAAIGLERYLDAWKDAVGIFGPNQVSSFLIAGLGEKTDSILYGSEVMSDIGVFPFIVPLRPIPGSLMEHVRPPDPDRMISLYETVALIVGRKGLSSFRSRAGCVRCGACSALSYFEKPLPQTTCHQARTKLELDRAMEIRKEVFVDEQRLFPITDRDESDTDSIHLVAECNNQIVGTVRVFPTNGCSHWVGGRLAVSRNFRTSGAATILVKEAMRLVKRAGCKRFTAFIQEQNVPFFLKNGWETAGEMECYHGKPHQPMVADLNRI